MDPVGLPTIGWGSRYDKNGVEVTMRTRPITLQEANQLLVNTVIYFENAVNAALNVEATQNQFDACISFAYNIGAGAFRKSNLLKSINYGTPNKSNFMEYVYAKGKKIKGLETRRNKEADLFFA
jgi:lysozyme